MPKKRRRKKGNTSGSPVVQVKDVTFAIQVRDDKAVIHAEQGVVVLVVNDIDEESGGTFTKAYGLPAGVPINAEMFGQEVDITIRDLTDEVILELGEDDVYEEELQQDESLMAIDSVDDLEEIYNERKIQMFTKLAGTLGTFVAGCALAGFCYWLLGKDFHFEFLLYPGMVAGILLGVLFGLVPCVRGLRSLSSKIVMDKVGNWVNMETGKSNLDGGIVIPVKKG